MKWKRRGKAFVAAQWVAGKPFVFVQTLRNGEILGEVFPVPNVGGVDFEPVATTKGRDPAVVRVKLERWAADPNRAAIDRARFDTRQHQLFNELDEVDRGG